MDSALDSTNPQNPYKKIKWMVVSFGGFESLKEGDSTFGKSQK